MQHQDDLISGIPGLSSSFLNIIKNISAHGKTDVLSANRFEKVFDHFKVYYTVGLIVFGIFANVTCLIQCTCRNQAHFWESTWTHYVVSICMADFSALTILASEWIFHVILVKPQNDTICKLSTFLGYFGTFLCPWLILLMTIERFMVVRSPLRRNRIVNVHRVRIVLFLVFVAAFLFNFWTLTAYRIEIDHFAAVNRPSLNVTPDNGAVPWYCTVASIKTKRIWDNINLVFVFILPSALIFQLNLSIGVLLVRQRRRYYRKNAIPNSISTKKVRRADMKTARKLIIVSVLYVIFNCPFYAIKVSNLWFSKENYHYRKLLTEASQLLLMTQYACHCFIYSNFVKEAVTSVRHSAQSHRTGSRISSMSASFYHGRDSVLTIKRGSVASITIVVNSRGGLTGSAHHHSHGAASLNHSRRGSNARERSSSVTGDIVPGVNTLLLTASSTGAVYNATATTCRNHSKLSLL